MALAVHLLKCGRIEFPFLDRRNSRRVPERPGQHPRGDTVKPMGIWLVVWNMNFTIW